VKVEFRASAVEGHGQYYNTSFFVTYKWTLYARVLHYGRLQRRARDKQSSLVGPFVSYEENEML
jgi:hypothetical protein